MSDMGQRKGETREEYNARQRAYYAAKPGTWLRLSAEKYAGLTPEQKRAKVARELELRRESPALKRKRADHAKLVRDEVIAGYGGRCVCCGNDYRPHLTLDHVHGDGAAMRRKAGSAQMSIYYALRRGLRAGEPLDPSFQVLCQNCNVAKHWLGACGCQDHQTPDPRLAFANSTASI